MVPPFVAKVRSAGSRRREGHWGREKEVDHAVHLSTRGDVTRDGSAALHLETSPTNFC